MDGIQTMGVYGYERVKSNDEIELLRAVRLQGPITVMFQVSADFISYKGGIYEGSPACLSKDAITHSLLIVGYDTDPATNEDYWIALNSWGVGWGEKGYVRIRRGSNVCGLASCATYPVNLIDPALEPKR